MWLCLIVLCAFGSALGQNCRDDDPKHRSCEAVCDEKGDCRIKAALLFPKNTSYDASLLSVQPVFDLAYAAAKDVFPPGVRFEWATYDVTNCDAAHAVISAIDAYNDCSHVFFGPGCDYALASVARISKFLGSTGTPIITTGGFSFDFVEDKQSCDDEYYMLVRPGPLGFRDLSYFIIDVMRQYNWRQIKLFTEANAQLHIAGSATCFLMMQTFANYLKRENIIFSPWDTSSAGGMNYTENLKKHLGYTNFTNSNGVDSCFYTKRRHM